MAAVRGRGRTPSLRIAKPHPVAGLDLIGEGAFFWLSLRRTSKEK
jgi:hypothetical protein